MNDGQEAPKSSRLANLAARFDDPALLPATLKPMPQTEGGG